MHLFGANNFPESYGRSLKILQGIPYVTAYILIMGETEANRLQCLEEVLERCTRKSSQLAPVVQFMQQRCPI